MAARRTAIRQLFAKGQVTDTDTADLTPDQAEFLQDVVWTANGDLAKRGGFIYASGANPLNGNTDAVIGCMVLPVPDTSFPETYTYKLVVTNNQGQIGMVGSPYLYSYGTANVATTATVKTMGNRARPLMVWQKEVIMISEADISIYKLPFRWGGVLGTENASPAGTVTVTTGSDQVTGAATTFTSQVTAGQYINITDANGVVYCFLVDFVLSNTSLRITSKAQVTAAGAAYTVTNFGFPNISSLLSDKGTVTTAASTATGKGTSWDTGLDQPGSALYGKDWMCGTAASTRYSINSVTNDNTLTLGGAAGLTDSNIVIGRPLQGDIVCAHAGRLWVAGVAWAPNRLQVTPVGHNLNDIFNGVDSSTTDPDNAAIIESVDVPDNSSPGYITALASGNDPGPLVICRDRDAYIAYGEWPSIQITKLGDDIGCFGWQGITFHGRTFYWAGVEGVFAYSPGGGVRNLTEGRIYREWKAAMVGREEIQAIIAVVNRTLFVSLSALGTPFTGYMLDLDREAWSTFTDYAWSGVNEVVFSGIGRDVFVTETGTNRVVSLRSATESTYAGVTNSLKGSFLARSGRMLMGSAGDLGRVIDSKVTYRMTAGSSPQFTVKYGSTSLNTAATVTTTTSGTAFNTVRVKPGSTNLGTASRDMQVEFAESSGTPARLEISEFSWVTRERRKRA